MPRITVLPPLDNNAEADAPVTQLTYADIEVAPTNVVVGDPIFNRRSLSFADYQRAFSWALDCARSTPSENPCSELISIPRRPPTPMRRYRWPVWAIDPERTELGYMAQNRISPWGGDGSTLYSSDLPDHGDRVFPIAKRRGDYYLPLAWPTSKVEVRA